MDQLKEPNDSRDMRRLLMEVLKVQERILHRLEQLEDTLAQLKNK